jgi:hypothetical protein
MGFVLTVEARLRQELRNYPDGAAAAHTLTGFHKERSATSDIGGSGAVTRYTF